MQAIVLGVVIDESDAVVLKKLIDATNKEKKFLTKTNLKNPESQLRKLITCGFVKEEIVKRSVHYLISGTGLEAFNNLPLELKELASKKKSSVAKSKNNEEIAALNRRIDTIDKKIDQILNILTSSQINLGIDNGRVPENGNKADHFEKALVDEYKNLRSREFLSDGKVWQEQLKTIMIDRHGYKNYEYEELLQGLKQTKIGMISISQGKDKTWIEIRT
jgi:hypothetical protein